MFRSRDSRLFFVGGSLHFPARAGRLSTATVVLTDSVLRCGGSDTVRFGRLHSGEVGVSRLWFENRTSRPVVIVSVTRSCGCTSLSYDAAPIRSGEVRAVEVSFDSRGEFGWQFKRVDLFFAGFAQPFRLFAEADVE